MVNFFSTLKEQSRLFKWFKSDESDEDIFNLGPPYQAMVPDAVVTKMMEEENPQNDIVKSFPSADLLQAQSDVKDAVVRMRAMLDPYWGWLPAAMQREVAVVFNDLDDATKRLVELSK